MTLIIGLTGSIGTGKSTVSTLFKDRGIPVVDADLIARQVVEPGEQAYREIVDTFGNNILHADGTLNRKALGGIIFSDEAKRLQLNAIIHPAIRTEMLHQRDAHISTGAHSVVLDIPLLFESKLMSFVEKIIVVSVDPAIQLERIIARDGSSEEEALKRINSQMLVVDKVKLADVVIDNNGLITETAQQLDEILAQWSVF